MSVTDLATRRAPINSFDADTRTFSAIAATGAPIRRREWDGTAFTEQLVVTREAVDFARLGSGRAPLLDAHLSFETRDQIGVITSARIERGELVVEGQLSPRPEVDGIATDLAAGVLRNVSVGYRIIQRQTIRGEDGQPPTVRITRWEPLEVSLVPIGADPNAHVRSMEAAMPDDEVETERPPQPEPRTFGARERRQLVERFDLGDTWRANASSSVSTQNAASIVIDSRHASTRRLNQSSTTAR